MTERVRLGSLDEFPQGQIYRRDVGKYAIAWVNAGNRIHAFADVCPHQQVPLSGGTVEAERTIVCPKHGWRFHLDSGEAEGRPGSSLKKYSVFTTGNDLFVELPGPKEDVRKPWDGVTRYVIRYGVMGWIAQFGSVEKIDCRPRDRVVVHTRRGLEIGEVLTSPQNGGGLSEGKPAGEVLRLVGQDEAEFVQNAGPISAGELAHWQKVARETELGMTFLDGERLLDGETIVLYYLGTPSQPVQELALQLQTHAPGGDSGRIILEPAVELPASSGGCGGGGGCGTCGH